MSDNLLDYSLLEQSLVKEIGSESELIKSIKKISENFTLKRESLNEYVEDPKLVSAYVLFYMATNVPKFPFLFNQLPQEILEDMSKCNFVDFGCGPGTYLLGHSLFFKDFENKLIGIDQSRLMIDQAKKVLNSFNPDQKKIEFYENYNFPTHENEILNFGNSANEISLDLFKDILKKRKPKYLTFIEPGTKTSFLELMKIREYLFENGYDCLFPCPSSHVKCPIKIEEKISEQNWCHQVLQWSHPEKVQRLAQLVQLDRNTMPLIAQAYVKQGHFSPKADSSKDVHRGFVVRKYPENKHSLIWDLCLDDEDLKGIYKIEIPKKSLSKKEVKELKKSSTGKFVKIKVIKKLGETYLRCKLE